MRCYGADNVVALQINDAKIWKEYDAGTTVNARIAKDIDKLENYLQLKVYLQMGANIEDSEKWESDLLLGLTEIGRIVYSRLKEDESLISDYLIPSLEELQPEVMQHMREMIAQAN